MSGRSAWRAMHESQRMRRIHGGLCVCAVLLLSDNKEQETHTFFFLFFFFFDFVEGDKDPN